MKISSGVYRGCEIEFGLISGSPGQCYVSLRFASDELKPIFSEIDENLIRKTFGFPDGNGDNFNATIDKANSILAWTFFYEYVGRCTQYEFLASIFNAIDKMVGYIPPNKEESDDSSKTNE